MNDKNVPGQGSKAGVTAGQAKAVWSEVMFYLAAFFGVLHFIGINLQLAGMFAHTTLKRELALPFTSSMLMGHLYLTFLAAYAGSKEFVRWFKKGDDEVLTVTESKKITRGLYFVIGWSVFTGLVVFIQQMGLIAEVPNVLLYTLTEVVGLLCGTEVSKFLRNRQATQKAQTAANKENYEERVLDYCREKGSADRAECENQFGLSEDQAYRLLKKLVSEKRLVEYGETKNRRYKLP